MITLTNAAQQHLQENLANSPVGTLGIRLGLRDAGCSGFAYTMDFASETQAEDEVFMFDQIRIVISRQYLQALNGMEIDLVQSGVNSTLAFNNPNVVNTCGCGESFQFRDDKEL